MQAVTIYLPKCGSKVNLFAFNFPKYCLVAGSRLYIIALLKWIPNAITNVG